MLTQFSAQYNSSNPQQLTSGTLNSMDDTGHGFAQKYGYFETKAKLPKGPATWPAFWTLDQTNVQARAAGNTTYALEIDIFENYGAGSSVLRTTLHYWAPNGKGNAYLATAKMDCGVINGFHTYGFDYQEDYLTFYYDRQQFWRIPNTFDNMIFDSGYSSPGGKFDRPLYILVDNAAPDPNADESAKDFLRGNPQDMLVEYVKVWQGSGGSDGVFTTADVNSITFSPSFDGQQYKINTTFPTLLSGGYQLAITTTGKLQFVDSLNKVLWQTNTTSSCENPGDCTLEFAYGDLYLKNGGSTIWRTYTSGKSVGFVLSNTSPYLQLVDIYCGTYWDSISGEQTPNPYPPPSTCSASTNYTSTSNYARWPTNIESSLTLRSGTPVTIQGIRLELTETGDIQLWNTVNSTMIWNSATTANCSDSSNCKLWFQTDGNLVLYS